MNCTGFFEENNVGLLVQSSYATYVFKVHGISFLLKDELRGNTLKTTELELAELTHVLDYSILFVLTCHVLTDMARVIEGKIM